MQSAYHNSFCLSVCLSRPGAKPSAVEIDFGFSLYDSAESFSFLPCHCERGLF